MKGFFSASAWQGQRMPLALVPECGTCGLYKGCITPKMPPTGKGKRKVLIIAEAPGENEDERGIQLIGNAGTELSRLLFKLGVNLRKDCWLDNSIRCRPLKNRKPTKDEVAYCRPNIRNTIDELKPDVIIPMGESAIKSVIPLAWKDGEVSSEDRWIGWTIPSQTLNTWICPTYHPYRLCRTNDPALELTMTRHMRRAFTLEGKPWPSGPPDYKKPIQIEFNPEKAAATIACMMAFGRPLAIDIETSTLKPDGPHAEILCCAISDGIEAVAYPWQGAAIEQTKTLLLSSLPKDVANLRFESRWFRRFLKIWPKNWRCDTLLSTHLLNCLHGICSVKFQSFVLFGVPDYDSHIEPYKKSKDNGSNSPNRMKELEPSIMLEYCALDALHESRIANLQIQDIPS